MNDTQSTAGQATAEQKTPLRMIYMYSSHSTTGKVQTVWAVSDQANDGQPLDLDTAKVWYFGSIPHLKTKAIGNVYTFQAVVRSDNSASVTFVDPKADDIPQWKNVDDRRAWSLKERSDKIEYAERARLKKSGDAWKDGLYRYKKAYHAETSFDGRAAILAAIIQEIIR